MTEKPPRKKIKLESNETSSKPSTQTSQTSFGEANESNGSLIVQIGQKSFENPEKQTNNYADFKLKYWSHFDEIQTKIKPIKDKCLENGKPTSSYNSKKTMNKRSSSESEIQHLGRAGGPFNSTLKSRGKTASEYNMRETAIKEWLKW